MMSERKIFFNNENNVLQGIDDNLNPINPLGNVNPIPSAPLPLVEDSADDVNFIIRHLGTPSDNLPTYVSKKYNNDSIVGNEIQAYAKIAGCNWTYYVKSLSISIGRNTEFHTNNSTANANAVNNPDLIDIDLGPSKVVSRKHASIEYNLNGRKWQLFIHGRNGLKVNGLRLNISSNIPYDLTSGNIIDIGGTQMMFILPDAPPVIPNYFRHLLANKRVKLNNSSYKNNYNSGTSTDNKAKSENVTNQVKAFQLQEGIPALHPNSISSEQDYSKDEARDLKPPYSYATMITQAILSNPQGILSLAEIYDWISSHFAYYRHTKQGWQNSIRHNLSLNKAFEKVPRKPNEPGKGMKWQISESYRNEFLKKWQDGSLNKIRRGTSVSRQLQLHLIRNNALPKGRTSPTFINEEPKNQNQNPVSLSNPIPFSQEKMTNSSYTLPVLSPNKNMHADMGLLSIKHESNSNLHSPVKAMSIPDINYLNTDTKISSGLVSGLDDSNTSDKLLHNNHKSDSHNMNHINSNSNNRTNTDPNPHFNKPNDDGLVRPNYVIPSIKTSQVNNNHDEPSLASPKKIFQRLDLMTPERNLQRPVLEPNSAQSHPSVNSSPALWNYVQFSTPLGPSNNNGAAGNGNHIDAGDHDKLPKLELESPLKNRRSLGKISDLKDVDLVKGFKQ